MLFNLLLKKLNKMNDADHQTLNPAQNHVWP